MTKIGDGGGRIPGSPPVLPGDAPAKAPDAAKPAAAPNDAFERGQQVKAQKTPEPPLGLKVEQDPKFNEMLKQTRNDPKAMNALAHTLNLAFNRFASDFQADRAKAGTLLDNLAKAGFVQGAVEHVRAELQALRERMNATRQRMATQKRRLRALRQLAGRVSDSKLADEIAGIEARIELLDTGWAEAFVGLGLGKAAFQPQDEEIPDHLRNVIKAAVTGTKRNHDAEAVGEVVAEMHPARLVTQMAAREIDGATRKMSAEVMDRVRRETGGTHGRTVQAIAAMYELFDKPDDET